MRNLRLVRRVWAWRAGKIERPDVSDRELLVVAYLMARLPVPSRGP
jgi:hypothetical protein